MKKPTIYIYPSKFRPEQIAIASNPYIQNLHKALSREFNVINVSSASRLGQLIDVYKYVFKQIDYIYFNWIESIGGGKYSFIQYCLYKLLISILQFKKTRIIYLLHNKLPHNYNNLSKSIMIDLIKQSDLLLAHSKEGIDIFKNINEKASCFYIPHPIVPKPSIQSTEPKEFDVLIWGSIHRYKGVDRFLEVFVKKGQLRKRYTIKIAGKIVGDELVNKIESFSSKNIIIENWMHTDQEIERLIKKSRIILFTYLNESVLSSGALMNTLALRAKILGPNIGAFKDLSKVGLISTYIDIEDLFCKIEILSSVSYEKLHCSCLDDFIKNNTWSSYASKIKAILEVV